MIHIIYPLGTGSAWNDMEIRLSISSVRKFCTDPDIRIYVCGCPPPEDIEDIHFISVPKVSTSRYQIVPYNLLMAMNHIDSDELTIIMNDDFFAIKHFSFVNMPLWYDMTIHQRANKQGISETYKNNLINSMMLPDDLNFAVHFPMPVRRPDIFKKVLTRCYKRDRDISFRNTYGNQCRLLGDTIEQMDDLKLYEQYKLHEIVALLAGKTWFSIGDRFLTDQNKSILKHLLS